MDAVAARWREAFLATAATACDLPLLLSGGMDSTTLLAGFLALDRPPPAAYAYRLDGQGDSEDLLAARKLASRHGLDLRVVPIPCGDADLLALTREVLQLVPNPRKTAVQCNYALLPMLRRIRADGFTAAVIGTGGVSEDNRRATILAADYERNREELEALRRRNLLGADPSSATQAMKDLGRAVGVYLREPFAEDPLASVALSIPFPEVNSPVQKGIALRAFPEFFADGVWRRNSSLQVNGGVRDLHERLLALPVNRRGSRRVVAIYNDLLEEGNHGEQLVFA